MGEGATGEGDAGEGDAVDDLTEDERAALQQVERGLESVHRAHGSLVAFHHQIGRAMEHFDEAESRLGDEHEEIAERLRDDVLPAGVTDDGKLTYELVAEFEDGLLSTVESISDATLSELADGTRYPIERSERRRDDGSA